jgi:hypothetical protein
MTTHSSREFAASLPASESSRILFPLVPVLVFQDKQKPTGQLLLAVGRLAANTLFCSAHQAPSPRRHLIRVDVPVLIGIIRLAFWEVGFMFTGPAPNLVMLLPAQSWLLSLGFEFLKELHQPVDQPAPASDDMEAALVLMLFQYLVQAAFQLIHTAPPQLGSSSVDNRELPRPKALRPVFQNLLIRVTIGGNKQKFEILIACIDKSDRPISRLRPTAGPC